MRVSAIRDAGAAEHELNVEISENEVRKEFTWTERLEYARRLERIESVRAKERMVVGKTIDPVANVPQGKTREIVAAQLGTSATQLRKAQTIVDHADLLDPADFADWDEGKLSTNKAFQKVKAAQKQAEKERDEAETDAANLLSARVRLPGLLLGLREHFRESLPYQPLEIVLLQAV